MIICELTFSIGSSWIVYSGYCIPALVHPKMSLWKIFYLQARLSVLWREEGQKNDVIPSKGFLFPAYLLLAGGLELGRRVQRSDYLFAVLDVDFVACGKSLVVVFEPNHLNHIWHLGGIDGRISNGNITWLDTHQCRGNTGISNGTGWRLHHIGFFQFQTFTFSHSPPIVFFLKKIRFHRSGNIL